MLVVGLSSSSLAQDEITRLKDTISAVEKYVFVFMANGFVVIKVDGGYENVHEFFVK